MIAIILPQLIQIVDKLRLEFSQLCLVYYGLHTIVLDGFCIDFVNLYKKYNYKYKKYNFFSRGEQSRVREGNDG